MASREIGLYHPDYPDCLRGLRSPPSPLFVRGELSEVVKKTGARIAMVGSRRASDIGLAVAAQLSAAWTAAGAVIVSGGALGIDAASHQAAIDAGGRTAVVLPTPIARPGPARNRVLFEQILEAGGCWLSEVEAENRRTDFAIRNRIIAALADLVVVIEAQPGSGTRHTVVAARALGRPVAAVAWGPGQPGFAGFAALIKTGARPIADAADGLALLPAKIRPVLVRSVKTSLNVEVDEAGLRLLAALSVGDRSVDALTELLAQPPSALLARLTEFELAGWVVPVAGARFGLSLLGQATRFTAKCTRTPTQIRLSAE